MTAFFIICMQFITDRTIDIVTIYCECSLGNYKMKSQSLDCCNVVCAVIVVSVTLELQHASSPQLKPILLDCSSYDVPAGQLFTAQPDLTY